MGYCKKTPTGPREMGSARFALEGQKEIEMLRHARRHFVAKAKDERLHKVRLALASVMYDR